MINCVHRKQKTNMFLTINQIWESQARKEILNKIKTLIIMPILLNMVTHPQADIVSNKTSKLPATVWERTSNYTLRGFVSYESFRSLVKENSKRSTN